MDWISVGIISLGFLICVFIRYRKKKKKPENYIVWVALVQEQAEWIEAIIWCLRRWQRRYALFDLLAVVDCGSQDQTGKILLRLWRQKRDFYLSFSLGGLDGVEQKEPDGWNEGENIRADIKAIFGAGVEPVIYFVDLRDVKGPLCSFNRRPKKAAVDYFQNRGKLLISR